MTGDEDWDVKAIRRELDKYFPDIDLILETLEPGSEAAHYSLDEIELLAKFLIRLDTGELIPNVFASDTVSPIRRNSNVRKLSKIQFPKLQKLCINGRYDKLNSKHLQMLCRLPITYIDVCALDEDIREYTIEHALPEIENLENLVISKECELPEPEKINLLFKDLP